MKSLTVKKLSATIIKLTTNKEIQQKAQLLGQLIRAQDGVARAIEAIHTNLAQQNISPRT